MDTIAVKRWLQRRQKHFKLATDEYLDILREALKRSNQFEISLLDEKSITVLIETDAIEPKSMKGISVRRSDLPGAKVNERVRLFLTETNDKSTCALVRSISPTKVEIKFDKTPPFPKEEEKKNETTKAAANTVTEETAATNSSSASGSEEENIKDDKPADVVAVGSESNNKEIEKRTSGNGNQESNSDAQENSAIRKKKVHQVVIKFELEPVFTRDDRIKTALRELKKSSISLPMHKFLLGNYKDVSNEKFTFDRIVSIYGIIPVKGKQLRAIEQSMRKRISLVESVAGGGKTLVAAHLACLMSSLRHRKVLVCSPIQATVDKLAKLIHGAGMNVIQLPQLDEDLLCAKRRRLAQTRGYEWRDTPYSLDYQIDDQLLDLALHLVSKIRNDRQVFVHNDRSDKKISNLARKISASSSDWQRQKMERLLLSRADIVCCTTIQAGSQLLAGLKFGMLIIDDAQMAPEIDCLVPISIKGVKQVTLLGNVRQEILLKRCSLSHDTTNSNNIAKGNTISQDKQFSKPDGRIVPNMVMIKNSNQIKKNANNHKQTADLNFEQAYQPGGLFNRLLTMGLSPVFLKRQYRMQEALAEFPNYQFYGNSMRNDSKTKDKLKSDICNKYSKSSDTDTGEKFLWLPNNQYMTALFDTSSIKEALGDLIDNLLQKEGVEASKISIITNVHYHSISCNEIQLETGTVADFIGREQDFIILLGENSHKEPSVQQDLVNNWDYLKNDLALEVALTRAKLGLFIVTDLKGAIEKDCQMIEKNENRSDSNSCKPQLTNCCESWRKLVEFYRWNKLVN